MLNRLKALLVVGTLGAGLAVVLPATAAQAVTCNNSYTNTASFGHSVSHQCYDSSFPAGWLAYGDVTDDKADGYCVYIRVLWTDGSVNDSNWACPKGKTIHYTIKESGKVWSRFSIEKIRVTSADA
jgi:hypothetical protein